MRPHRGCGTIRIDQPAGFVYYLFMAKTIEVIPKKRGRPATGKDPILTFRSPPELTLRIEIWAASQSDPRPSRSEALRLLVEKGLASDSAPQSEASLEGQIVSRQIATTEIPEFSKTRPEAGLVSIGRAIAKNNLREIKSKRAIPNGAQQFDGK
jgi:hypothetical protein